MMRAEVTVPDVTRMCRAGAAATPLDGYPMTKAGRSQQELAISFVSSTAGGL